MMMLIGLFWSNKKLEYIRIDNSPNLEFLPAEFISPGNIGSQISLFDFEKRKIGGKSCETNVDALAISWLNFFIEL